MSRLATALLLVLASLAASVIARGQTGGSQAPVVRSPGHGYESDKVIEPERLWSIDTEQEEVLIGRIADAQIGPDGNIYLLDNQLSEIFVYSPDGKYLRTIGHEGEGPGEFHNPMGMFFLGDGTLGVLQLMPGKVAMLDLEGTPVGDLPVPRSADDTPQMLMGGASAGNHVVLQLTSHAMADATIRVQSSLVGVSREGSVVGTYFDHVDEQKVQASGGRVAIAFDRDSIGRWAAGPDGTLYHAPARHDYAIDVRNPQGELLRVIGREYEPRQRTKIEIEARREAMADFGGPAPEIDPTDPDIAELVPRPDGWLWVLTSRGQNDRPEGSVGVYDVFDPQGRFQRQLTLSTGFDRGEDLAFVRGDRLLVVENGAGTLTSGGGDMQIVMRSGDGEDEEGEAEPMRIHCYRLEE